MKQCCFKDCHCFDLRDEIVISARLMCLFAAAQNLELCVTAFSFSLNKNV